MTRVTTLLLSFIVSRPINGLESERIVVPLVIRICSLIVRHSVSRHHRLLVSMDTVEFLEGLLYERSVPNRSMSRLGPSFTHSLLLFPLIYYHPSSVHLYSRFRALTLSTSRNNLEVPNLSLPLNCQVHNGIVLD